MGPEAPRRDEVIAGLLGCLLDKEEDRDVRSSSAYALGEMEKIGARIFLVPARGRGGLKTLVRWADHLASGVSSVPSSFARVEKSGSKAV
jgi:hypothetical protein